MKITLLNEPLIEFANDFLCDDPKKGIMAQGFYSLSNKSHKSEIQYSVIGTKKLIQAYKNWLNQFNSPIESTSTFKLRGLDSEIEENSGEVFNLFSSNSADNEVEEIESYSIEGVNKKANPDFPGFNLDSCFKCSFLNNDENDGLILEKKIDDILNSENNKIEKLSDIVDLYKDTYVDIIENDFSGTPDIIVIVISSNIFNQLGSVSTSNTYINLRRKLKAEILALNLNVPVQLILEETINDKKKSLQDLSMIAWNYCVAQYYKTSNCLPWTIKDIDSDTCYLGISFHKVIDDNSNIRSSIAQAFNKDGKGLVFTGKQFEWNNSRILGSAPHLDYDYAKELIQFVLGQYTKINKHTPKRVVIHKTTSFWDSYINKNYNELDGFLAGISEALGNEVEVDLVTIKNSKIRFLREGMYPVLRGTMGIIEEDKAILYTNGYIPYFGTYPGSFIPLPLEIENIGETPIENICKEILALTKMNFNNCDYCDGLPITIQFSQKVGEIIQYFPPDLKTPPNKYFYYM